MNISKESYSQAVSKLLSKYPNLKRDTNMDHYIAFTNHYSSKSKWSDLAEILNISTKQAHDYFYNTWSQQFYDNPYQYKEELRGIYAELLKTEKKCTAITKAIEAL